MTKNMVGEARLSCRRDGPVLLVTVVGLVTVPTIQGIRAWIVERTSGARSVAVDYTGSVLALTDENLRQLAAPGGLQRADLPMAWAVPDQETAALWMRQIVRCAFAGQRRHVTCDLSEALEWARSQASQV
jgi:hypothetical protein